MSIKIYNGLRAIDSDPFQVAHDAGLVMAEIFVNFFTDSIQVAAEASRNKTTWEDAFEVPMDYSWCEEPVWRQVGRSLDGTVWDAVNTLAKGNTRTKPYGCTLAYGYTMGLYRNGMGGNPLAILFAEEEIYREHLIAEGIFENYGYWDNSDREDGLTEEEWDERREAWGTIIHPVTGAGRLEVPMPGYMDSEILASSKRRRLKREAEEASKNVPANS